jgi:hypothetical protein
MKEDLNDASILMSVLLYECADDYKNDNDGIVGAFEMLLFKQ